MAAFAIAVVAGCYDDGDLQEKYDDLYGKYENLDNRVASLETLCNQMNTNISSLQTIVAALQSNDGITNVYQLPNGEGYTITFTSGKTITIYNGQNGADGKDGANGKDGKDGVDGANGKDGVDGEDGKDGVDGKDGSTPVVGVKQGVDGIYYWTINGEWLLDANGERVKAVGTDGKDGENGKDGVDGTNGKDGENGKDGQPGQDGKDGENGKDGADGQDGKDGIDGITPQLKIEDGYWFISVDSGATWTKLGKATGENGKDGTNGKDGVDGKKGDSMFSSVVENEDNVVFTLSNGTAITIAKNTDIVSKINSIRLIPTYDQAGALVTYDMVNSVVTHADITLVYDIYPGAVAADIVSNWNELLSIDAVYTEVLTKTAGETAEFTIKSVTRSGGRLTVKAEATSLLEGYAMLGNLSLSVSLVIANGTNSIASEFVPVVKKCLSNVRSSSGDGVLIDGLTWAEYNVGATAKEEHGNSYSYSTALSVCPDGWRLPTVSEYEKLFKNKSEVTFNGVAGCWCSGSITYTTDTPIAAVFFPMGDWRERLYWTSDYEYSSWNGSYDADESESTVCHVRCVKD